jgi:hypothetical protein
MSPSPLDNLLHRWAAIGAGFDMGTNPSSRGGSDENADPDPDPDLERLLLDTARHASSDARLFIMAATWLHAFGDLIAKHRLKRLIRDELEIEHQAKLGLLLDIAQHGSHPLEFETVIKILKPAPRAQPLFAIHRTNRSSLRSPSERARRSRGAGTSGARRSRSSPMRSARRGG